MKFGGDYSLNNTWTPLWPFPLQSHLVHLETFSGSATFLKSLPFEKLYILDFVQVLKCCADSKQQQLYFHAQDPVHKMFVEESAVHEEDWRY